MARQLVQLIVASVQATPGAKDITIVAHPVEQPQLPTAVTMPLAMYLILGWREGDLVQFGASRINNEFNPTRRRL